MLAELANLSVSGRPRRIVVVAGTGTEVGKTWVAARVIEQLRRDGVAVAARKPAQSFGPDGGPSDASVLARASGEDHDTVCPPHRSYDVAMAPFMAAEVLGRSPFTLTDLVQEVQWPSAVDVGLVESAGGVGSPISSDGADSVDLARQLGATLVVLVADAGLGTINAVRLSVAALHGFEVAVFLNRYDETVDLHRRNRDWLKTHLQPRLYTDVSLLARAVAGR